MGWNDSRVELCRALRWGHEGVLDPQACPQRRVEAGVLPPRPVRQQSTARGVRRRDGRRHPPGPRSPRDSGWASPHTRCGPLAAWRDAEC